MISKKKVFLNVSLSGPNTKLIEICSTNQQNFRLQTANTNRVSLKKASVKVLPLTFFSLPFPLPQI